jgi:uncharacterized protein YbjT (DUF2867 family)
MRVLIIGGTGLISTSITRQLLEVGAEVTLFNRGDTDARIPLDDRIIDAWEIYGQQLADSLEGVDH